jgi:hypothetical protein
MQAFSDRVAGRLAAGYTSNRVGCKSRLVHDRRRGANEGDALLVPGAQRPCSRVFRQERHSSRLRFSGVFSDRDEWEWTEDVPKTGQHDFVGVDSASQVNQSTRRNQLVE